MLIVIYLKINFYENIFVND